MVNLYKISTNKAECNLQFFPIVVWEHFHVRPIKKLYIESIQIKLNLINYFNQRHKIIVYVN